MELENQDSGKVYVLNFRYVIGQSIEGVRRFFSPVRNVREIRYAVRTGVEESNKSREELQAALSALTWKGLFRILANILKKLLKLS